MQQQAEDIRSRRGQKDKGVATFSNKVLQGLRLFVLARASE